MKNFYLIGSNIQNSLSPIIHNYIYNKIGINAKYKLFEIDNINQITKLIENCHSKNIYGINITNPYKKEVYEYVDKFSEISNEIGSINCIDLLNKNTVGHNTDWYGFLEMLRLNNINLINKEVKIIGLGGSYNAIMYAISLIGCSKIELFDRNNINEILDTNFTDKSVIINCTPKHFINESDIFLDHFINRKYLWIDLLYTELSTVNKKIINRNHYKFYINGIDMLIFQALASINIWLRKDIHKNVDLHDLKSTLKRA
mgnify:CR=1 FL=1|jgi:shikimate dehydrogenase